MNELSAPSPGTAATAIYVYGVVPLETPATLFEHADGVDASQSTTLIGHAGLAAIAGRVRLDEFGEEPLEANLRDTGWLEAKVRAHDAVLAAAVGQTTVVPFRFGAIYESEDHVRAMLAERRDLAEALARLDGAVELGVNAYADRGRFRERLAADRGAEGDQEGSGRAYMERRRLERELDTAVESFAGEVAGEAHEHLASAAAGARANPVRPSADGDSDEMLLNGAYLVPAGQVDAFRAAVAELQRRFGADGVVFELTGPWPPYNFVEAET